TRAAVVDADQQAGIDHCVESATEHGFGDAEALAQSVESSSTMQHVTDDEQHPRVAQYIQRTANRALSLGPIGSQRHRFPSPHASCTLTATVTFFKKVCEMPLRSPERARPPRQPRLHPGWWVAAVAFLALLGAAGFRGAPGALMVPLHHEFGW